MRIRIRVASVAMAASQDALAAPLSPVEVAVRAPGYSGPARLQLYDAALRPAGAADLTLADGRATATLLPRGRLGPQWATVTIEGRLCTVTAPVASDNLSKSSLPFSPLST